MVLRMVIGKYYCCLGIVGYGMSKVKLRALPKDTLWDYCLANGWTIKNECQLELNKNKLNFSTLSFTANYFCVSNKPFWKGIEKDLPLESQIKLLNCFVEVYSNE
jgi:hypothetical protein